LKSKSWSTEWTQTAKGIRCSTEQKIRTPREAEGSEKTIEEVCRGHQISEQAFYRWKREFGMFQISQARQLKELQRENARINRTLADEILGNELLMTAF